MLCGYRHSIISNGQSDLCRKVRYNTDIPVTVHRPIPGTSSQYPPGDNPPRVLPRANAQKGAPPYYNTVGPPRERTKPRARIAPRRALLRNTVRYRRGIVRNPYGNFPDCATENPYPARRRFPRSVGESARRNVRKILCTELLRNPYGIPTESPYRALSAAPPPPRPAPGPHLRPRAPRPGTVLYRPFNSERAIQYSYRSDPPLRAGRQPRRPTPTI